MIKILGKTINIIFIALLFSIVGLLLATMLPIPGNLEVKIVKSGSMEPDIMTGAVILTQLKNEYRIGEVITFTDGTADIPTTHRIVSMREENGETFFLTKGDANEEADNKEVAESAVLGKVLIDAPFVGYVLDFSRQPIGFGLLVGFPALLIVFDEIGKIWREARKIRRRKTCTLKVEKTDTEQKTQKKETPAVPISETIETPAISYAPMRMMDIGRPAVMKTPVPKAPRMHPVISRRPSHMVAASCALLVFGAALITGMNSVGSTLSYPIDIELSTDNTLQASALDFEVSSDGDVYTFSNNRLDDSDGAVISLVIPQEGSADALYSVRAEKTSGSNTFCSMIRAEVDDPFSYDGTLQGLVVSGVVFSGPWTLDIKLSDYAPEHIPGDGCTIDLVYTAWLSEGEEGEGYLDEERTTLEFYSSTPEPLYKTTTASGTPEVKGVTEESKTEEEYEEEAVEEELTLKVEEVDDVPEEIVEEISEEEETKEKKKSY